MEMELRHARGDEIHEVVDLLELVFGGSRKWFHNIITLDPWRDPRNTRVALIDGRIVAHVQVHKRPIRYGRSHLVLGGIGHVATHPDFRGQGLSTALLRQAIERMETSGYHLSLLYTGINGFYERLGWCTIPLSFPIGPVPPSGPAPSGQYRVEHIAIPEQLPEAPAIYHAWAAQWVGPLERTSEYWRRNPRWTNDEFIAEDPRAAMRASRDGRVYGYLRGRIDNLPPSRCAIDELCYLPGHEDCVPDLVHAFIEAARASSKELIELDCGEQHPCQELIRQYTDLRTETDTSAMFRIVDAVRLLNASARELSYRAASLASGLPTSMVIDYGVGRLRLQVAPTLRAEPTSSAADVQMTAAAFLNLVLGRRSAAELLAEGSLSWVGADRTEMIEALWSRHPYYYARLDKF